VAKCEKSEQARTSFFAKKEAKKLLLPAGVGTTSPQPAVTGVFLLLFLQKKKFFLTFS